MRRAAIVLAAGMGTRMKSATPKVLHRIAGRPMLGHVLAAIRAAGAERIVVVTAAGAPEVRDYAAHEGAESVIQEPQLGTGHAAAQAESALADFDGALVTAYGDMPLVTAGTYAAAFEARKATGLSLTAFEPADPASYGRVILNADGTLARIVEFKDANEDQRRTRLCNAGLIAADSRPFFRWAASLSNDNAQHEYYLTDIPKLAKADGVACTVVRMSDADAMGVNSRAELAAAEGLMQQRLRAAALEAGVGMIAPDTVFLAYDTALEADVAIGPYVVFGPGVTVKSGAEIKAFSHLEGAVVESGASVGPYARLRPGAHIGASAHVGNFVELKNARLGEGAKANHLTYLGDADIGAAANIGAGTITCNYDGFGKYKTEIGAGAFIGSNTSLVAPVKVGAGAITGAGSTITRDVEDGALGVERSEQVNRPAAADRFRADRKAKRESKER